MSGDPTDLGKRVIQGIAALFVISILGMAFSPMLTSAVGGWEENLTAQGGPTAIAAPIIGALPTVLWFLVAIFAAVGFALFVLYLRDNF